MEGKSEYNATATHAKACYSNIKAYGAEGRVLAIDNPKPASVVPQLFWRMPADRRPKYTSPAPADVWYARNCQPYSTMDGTGQCVLNAQSFSGH